MSECFFLVPAHPLMLAGVCYVKARATSRSLGALTFYFHRQNPVPFSVFVMFLGVQLFEAIQLLHWIQLLSLIHI